MKDIQLKQAELVKHPIYQKLTDLKSIQHFMSYHVFAVWDFMSLLKSLQRHVTCVDVPWRPSNYSSEMVRFINQIVVGEESDVDLDGKAISHFELYLKAMDEVGASTSGIRDFLETMDLSRIPLGAREFVSSNLEMAKNGSAVEVASSFFFGREKLIPEMFQAMVDVLKKENVTAPTFLYYLERHIEVDAHEHGPLALKCLEELTSGNEELKALALKTGLKALDERRKLWDEVERSLLA